MAVEAEVAMFDAGSVLCFGEDGLTGVELELRASGFASTLQRRGVRPGDRVALMSSNRPELVIALRAAWGLGASVVLMSPSWRAAEVNHALNLTGAELAVGDCPVLADALPMVSLDEATRPSRALLAKPRPDTEALLVFSSGTTGMPKAVRHTHASLGAAVANWRSALDLTSADRLQVTTPPSHILGLLNLITALGTGAWVRLHRRFDITEMLDTIARERITIEMAVAPIALALAAQQDLEAYDLSSVRFIVWGATPFIPGVAETITRRTGLVWITGYGATELPVIALNPLDDSRPSSVGRPVGDVQIRIVDPSSGEQLGADQRGEIVASSNSMMSGYLPAEETSSVIVNGWYHTGDIGSIDLDGYLTITDRIKEMIKVRGFQVAPAEIEAVLQDHSAVDDCAAFGVPDARDGEAIMVAVACRAAVSADDLISEVKTKLASYKCPRGIVFVESIPRLPSGKVLRRELREGYERGDVSTS